MVHETPATGKQGSELGRSCSNAHPKSAGYLMKCFFCVYFTHNASPQRTSSLKHQGSVDPALLSSLWACVGLVSLDPQSSTDPCSRKMRDEESGRKPNHKSVVYPESCNLKSREEGVGRGMAMIEHLVFQPLARRVVSAYGFVPHGSSDPHSPS